MSQADIVSDDGLGELRDRAALFDLAAAYARGVDRGRFEEVEALFVPGGHLFRYDGSDVSAGPVSDTRADGSMADFLRTKLERYEATTHFLGQQTVDIVADEATAETYCLAHHIYEQAGERVNRVLSIRYLDRCRRIDGSWRFEERALLVDWAELRPSSP